MCDERPAVLLFRIVVSKSESCTITRAEENGLRLAVFLCEHDGRHGEKKQRERCRYGQSFDPHLNLRTVSDLMARRRRLKQIRHAILRRLRCPGMCVSHVSLNLRQRKTPNAN